MWYRQMIDALAEKLPRIARVIQLRGNIIADPTPPR